MEVSWVKPASGVASYYDVYISTSQTANFVKANQFKITDTKMKVMNIRFGVTIYTKVKAIEADGTEGPFSSLANDALVSPVKATMQLTFRGPSGNKIANGAMFALAPSGQLIAVRTLAEGTIP